MRDRSSQKQQKAGHKNKVTHENFKQQLTAAIQQASQELKLKNLPAMWETQFDPWVGKIPWKKAWQPTPGFLPGEFHGQRSLAGYSPQSGKALEYLDKLTSFNRITASIHCIITACSSPVLWTECLGRDQIKKTGSSMMGLMSFKKRKRSESFCKDSAGRQMSANQQEVSPFP